MEINNNNSHPSGQNGSRSTARKFGLHSVVISILETFECFLILNMVRQEIPQRDHFN